MSLLWEKEELKLKSDVRRKDRTINVKRSEKEIK